MTSTCLEEEFHEWFQRLYGRLNRAVLSDSLLDTPSKPVDLRAKLAREWAGCYWLAQHWPNVPNRKLLLSAYERDRLHTLKDLNDLILRSTDGDEIRSWARDHADPAFLCDCC
ncbi:MAG: hypothetical protein H7Y37_00315 [Anaerolineae bacterium]|nr:hypothetical protein [Gloeobacterales cyanobacterium ES-bin-313]